MFNQNRPLCNIRTVYWYFASDCISSRRTAQRSFAYVSHGMTQKKHPTRVLLLFNAYPYGQRESGRILLWSQCLILVAHAKFCGKHARILFFCGISLFVLEELACTLNAVLPTVCALHFPITRNCHYNYWWCSLLHLWATYIHCHSVQLFRWMIFYLIWSNSHSGSDKISFS